MMGGILGIFSVPLNTFTPDLDPGNLFLIGRNNAAGWGTADGEFITGERVPAVSNIFSFATGEISEFIQLPRLVRPFWFPVGAGVEFDDIYLCAIDGDIALSAQISGSEQRWVAISNYLSNGDMLRYTDWVAATPEMRAVDCGEGLKLEGIFLAFPGKCVVKCAPVGADVSVFQLPIVLYERDGDQSSGFYQETFFIEIDLDALGNTGFTFSPTGEFSRWAFNASQSQLSINFQVLDPSDAEYMFCILIDLRSNQILYNTVYAGYLPMTPLDNIDGFTAEYIIDVEQDFEPPFTYDASYDNTHIKGVDATGETIIYTTYASREVSGAALLSFVDESADIEIDVASQMEDLAIDSGFTVTGSIRPPFGNPSTYITDNPSVLAGTQTFHADATGSFYAWECPPAALEDNYVAVGYKAGLPTSAPGDSAMGDVYPQTYGPHLGWGMGYISFDDATPPTYFYLCLWGATGNENYKLTGTGIQGALYTAAADFVEVPGCANFPIYRWLTNYNGIPHTELNDGIDVTIENLDEL
jgi:hypothetical protein